MKYITTAEAAKKWGLTRDRVLKLAKSGRIPDVEQIGTRWMIPENTVKPKDARFKTVDTSVNDQDKTFFRYPCFEGRDINSFDPPLTDIEIKIKKISDLFQDCKFLEAETELISLSREKLNQCHRIYYLRMACYIYHELSKTNEFFEAYKELSIELNKDFPHKKEMSSLIHEIDSTIGTDNYFINEFKIDQTYNYHKSFRAHLASLCLLTSTKSNTGKLSVLDLMPYEYICSSVNEEDSYLDVQTIHFYLGIEYGKILKLDEMKHHYQKALDLAYKYNLYYQPAMLYYYYANSVDIVLKNYPEDFIKKIKNLSKDLHNRYLSFMKLSSLENIYSKLPSKDYMYVYFALQGYSNKEVAGILNISESNVGNRYSIIYQTLGVHNKAELVEYYKKSTSTNIVRNE